MSSRISILQLVELSQRGRVAMRSHHESGQTAAGSHINSSAEQLVKIQLQPNGWGEIPGTGLVVVPVTNDLTCGGNPRHVFFDDTTGLVWWGAEYTLRVLPSSIASLEPAERVMDANNLAYQNALLRG